MPSNNPENQDYCNAHRYPDLGSTNQTTISTPMSTTLSMKTGTKRLRSCRLIQIKHSFFTALFRYALPSSAQRFLLSGQEMGKRELGLSLC